MHPDHDRGLEFDVRTLVARRSALGLLGGAGLAAWPACTDGSSGAAAGPPPRRAARPAASVSPSVTASGTASGARPPSTPRCRAETAGPFPGDGSNGQDVLDDTGIVRTDRALVDRHLDDDGDRRCRSPSNLTVLDSAARLRRHAGCRRLRVALRRAGPLLDVLTGVEDENYLRGVQPTDASGTATFTTVFPGCYRGRWPHIHFEVYRSTAEATSAGQIVRTSQLALPRRPARRSTATPPPTRAAPTACRARR